MKQILSVLLMMLFVVAAKAQMINGVDLKKVSPEKRKELISTLTPAEKKALIRDYRYGMLYESLNIDADKQDAFRKIHQEYQAEQRKIKDIFNPAFDPEKLSDEEAKVKLEQSFVVGEKLMESRRKYCKEFQKILTTQQILKLFQNEGAMREKMMEKRPHNPPAEAK